MLTLRVAPARIGRVTTASILQTQAKNFYSKKGTPSASSFSKVIRYIAIATVVSVPGLWLITTRDNVPRLENPGAEHLIIDKGPSRDEVTRMISQQAYSFRPRKVAGVNRYDGTQLASNDPCEDQSIHGKFTPSWDNGNQWMAWAVFDGHAGGQTVVLLKKHLLSFVRHSLSQLMPASKEQPTSEEAFQNAIMKGFVNLDDSIIKTALDTCQSTEPLQDKMKKLAPGYAGSCALLSLYDSATGTLHVACTGDSRAVLGQKNSDGTWETIPLSVDQTGSNEDEIARLKKEHPGEENMVKDGRVLGMMVSRAFGDGRWKWPLELQEELKRRFGGPTPLTPRFDVRTPPYLTAEPVVTTTKINPDKPSFLIMATDGMWDVLSSQQAVDLIGKWLESLAAKKRNSQLEPTYEPFDFGQFKKGVDWKFVEGRMTIQDNNAAVHLVRNAFGGNHHELIAGRLALGSPFSRRLRDDITVQVVFFNVQV